MAESVDVVVDSREPLEEILPHLMENDQVESFESQQLPEGDLLIEGVVFERKTPSDFATSMTDSDDHLKDQVERMANNHDSAYVLLEGDLSDFDSLSHSRINGTSLRGMAASITARNGVPVVPCSDTERLIDQAIRLARKHTEEPSSSSLRAKTSVEDTDQPVVKRMYGCIDGVGADTAASLHRQFPALQDALDASQSDLTAIDGVGPKTAQKIHDALHDSEVAITEETI